MFWTGQHTYHQSFFTCFGKLFGTEMPKPSDHNCRIIFSKSDFCNDIFAIIRTSSYLQASTKPSSIALIWVTIAIFCQMHQVRSPWAQEPGLIHRLITTWSTGLSHENLYKLHDENFHSYFFHLLHIDKITFVVPKEYSVR